MQTLCESMEITIRGKEKYWIKRTVESIESQNESINHLRRLLLKENIQFVEEFGIIHFEKIVHRSVDGNGIAGRQKV